VNPYVDGVESWKASAGIPAPSQSVDMVYHSHLLEHMDQEEGEDLIKECFRVLKPGGILRVVVPDLERICRDYLSTLKEVDQETEYADLNAHWMRLELFDQMTRKVSGGKMLQFLQSNPNNEEFLAKRCGKAILSINSSVNKTHSAPSVELIPIHLKFKKLLKIFFDYSWQKEKLLKFLLSNSDYETLQCGRFNQSGELHKQMFDRISLQTLLQQAGFSQCILQSHLSSLIPQWKEFYLDNNSAGEARKPDSLFLEAIKPK
jgi:hypothetical protein